MKKLLLTFSVLLGGLTSAFAQPSPIPGSKFFVPGNTFSYTDANFSVFNTGTPGANQTWDFSGLTNSGFSYVTQYVTAASTPYASSFPNANIATTDPTLGEINYQMVNTNSGALTFEGYVIEVSGVGATFNYTNPQSFFNLPLTYNANSSDTYSGSGSTSSGGITMTSYRYGSTSAVVDGWGTLITPTGTYTNCMRVRMREVSTDSMVFVGVPVPATVTHNISNSYLFVDGNGSIAYDRVRASLDSIIDASGTTVEQSMWYLSATSTGVSEAMPANTFNLYPNPAANEMYISPSTEIRGESHVTIMDITGRTVEGFTANFNTAAPVSVPVQNLRPGTYILSATTAGGTWTSRFVRQ